MSQNYKIVGAFYRKPAPAILDCLPLNTKLHLRFEYTNEYDPNAVMVIAKRDDFLPHMTDEAKGVLQDKCSKYGVEWDFFTDQTEWHVGYIPRDTAPPELYATLKEGVQNPGEAHINDKECFFQPDMGGKPALVVY